MSREDLIRFVRRDWAAVERASDQHWLRQKRATSGPDECRRIDDLLRHARAATGARSSLADRLADLDVHHRVGLALRAVACTAR